MTPGPSRVPQAVLAAGARPMIHHRSREFSAIVTDVLAGVARLFGTGNVVLPVHATGRGAMEATIANLLSPGDELLACCNGKFGELWARLAGTYGLTVHRVATAWDRDADLDELRATLAVHPRVRAVTCVQCDTSTGVHNDVAGIAELASEHGAMSFVDGVSSVGGVPFLADTWGVDVAVTASQKCLMSSAGLSFVSIGERAWRAVERASLPRSYWDFRDARAALARPLPQTFGTAPVHVYMQVRAALELIEREGLDAVFRRHAAMGRRAREGVRSLGLELRCPSLRSQAPIMTAVRTPEGLDPTAIRNALQKHGIAVAVGLGPFESDSFRIGHLGDIRLDNVERTLQTLADVVAHSRRNAWTAST